MKVLDLFSGIGGFSLGLERAGFQTVAFCEIEEYPRKVLKKHWPDIPIYNDVRELTSDRLESDGINGIDVICGGFPCQDISVAGKQEGIGEGTRSGLWSECARLLGELRPKYAIFENVTALLNGGGGDWFKRVLWEISSIGYDAEWHCIQPDFVGIPATRDRIWILAYPTEKHVEKVVDQGRLSLQHRGVGAAHLSRTGWAMDSSLMGRKPDGIPDIVDRFECLGNTVLPQIPELLGRAIMKAEMELRG